MMIAEPSAGGAAVLREEEIVGSQLVRMAVGIVMVAGAVSLGHADEVLLNPSKDNTLYEDAAGGLSNGAGQHLFSGSTGQNKKRRAVLEFDIAGAVPAGAVITGVELRLTLSLTIAGEEACALHRVTKEWGEGASQAPGEEGAGGTALAPDATWVHAMYPGTAWTTPGGDFAAIASATTPVAGEDVYTWGSTAEMIADVQAWLDDPSVNHGWVLIGNESALRTAKRFDSRENEEPANRPVLRVVYTAGCPIDYTGDGQVDFGDYLEFLNLYDGLDARADLNHDGAVDFADYLEFLNLYDGDCA